MPGARAAVRAALLALWTSVLCGAPAWAAPRTPASDAEVLERLPARASDPQQRELLALRAQWQRNPRDLDSAVALARRWYAQAQAEGDPRYVGHAQAVLAPWWSEPAPPAAVRVQRAVLLQYEHRFAEALADLNAVTQADPAEAEAWAWTAAIHMVRAEYAAARRACEALAPLTSSLIGTACTAYADSLSGRAGAAMQALRAALAAELQAEPAQRLWALTRLAEIEERSGSASRAEAAYREALALQLTDGYLLGAYADFLLDQRRPKEALALLKGRERSDILLLRLALAARAAGDPAAEGWTRELQARFDAARARGDRTHEKEEARFALHLQGQAKNALTLAQANWAEQREPADARALLETALAAKQPGAAEPVLQWLADNRVEHTLLRELVSKLKEAK